tara:strand:+ start:414 stop:626 length:213 start_codon:yes stop_codon:yes gene_type:complete
MAKKVKTFDELGASLKDPRAVGQLEIQRGPDFMAIKINDAEVYQMNTREAAKNTIQRLVEVYHKIWQPNV